MIRLSPHALAYGSGQEFAAASALHGARIFRVSLEGAYYLAFDDARGQRHFLITAKPGRGQHGQENHIRRPRIRG